MGNGLTPARETMKVCQSAVVHPIICTTREHGNTGKSCKEGPKMQLGVVDVFMMWTLKYPACWEED